MLDQLFDSNYKHFKHKILALSQSNFFSFWLKIVYFWSKVRWELNERLLGLLSDMLQNVLKTEKVKYKWIKLNFWLKYAIVSAD